jgi:RNA polymerase sigma factor (sigma-70 family)
VDRARAATRVTALPEEPEAADRLLSLVKNQKSANGFDGDPHRSRLVTLVRTALLAAIQALDPRSRLRLALYYTQGQRLAQIGRLLGESEATTSRKLEKTRREIRAAVDADLRNEHGLDPAQVDLAVSYAVDDPVLDLHRALPVPDS